MTPCCAHPAPTLHLLPADRPRRLLLYRRTPEVDADMAERQAEYERDRLVWRAAVGLSLRRYQRGAGL